MDYRYIIERYERQIAITFFGIALVLLAYFVVWPFLTLGKLVGNVNGAQSGEATIYSLKEKVKGSDKPVYQSKVGSEFSVKLRPGRYKVIYRSTDSDRTDTESFEEVEIRPRQTTNASISLSTPEVSGVARSIYKPREVHLLSDQLVILGSSGSTATFGLDGSTKGSVRRSTGSALGSVSGICTLSDGSLVLTDSSGTVYISRNSIAEALPYPASLQGSDDEEGLELQNTDFIGGTQDLICTKDQAILFGYLILSKDGVLGEFTVPSYIYEYTDSASTEEPGRALLFKKVDADSYGHDSTPPDDDSKKFLVYTLNSDPQTVKTRQTIAGISYYDDKACYYNLQDIYCFKDLRSTEELVLDLPDNRLITNILFKEEGKVIYSYSDSVFEHDMDQQESRLLYRANGTIINDTFDYEPSNSMLVFGVSLKDRSTQFRYEMPMIKL